MAYSGEVRVDTRVTTDNIKKDLAKAEREIAKISKAFDSTTASVRKQEIALSDLQRKYDALMEGQKTPASLSAMQTSLRNTEREIREVEKANKDLFAQYEAAAQRAEALRPFGETDTQFIKAQEQADILFKRLEPVEQKFAELNAKAQDLRQSIAGVKMTPETSLEAQHLADKIKLTTDNLNKSHGEAASLEMDLKLATAEAERLKGALGESGGAESAKASIDGIGQAAQTAAKIATSAFKKIGTIIGSVAKGATKVSNGILKIAFNILTLGAFTRKASGGVNGLFKRLLQLGAAAFVFNVLRKGLRELSDSIRNLLLANQEFASAWNNIRVNMISAFAPLWEVLEPAIVSFMQLLAQFTAVLARFMAILFGKTYTEARASAKALNDQSKALKGVGGAAKEASKQLASFDEINKLAAESGGGGGGGGAGGLDFEFEPPDVSWIDEIATDLMDTFKKAWDISGEYFLDGFRHMVGSIKDLIMEIAKTFWEVFKSDIGVEMLASIFHLLGTIFHIIGDIADAFLKAWQDGERGKALVESLFIMFTDILKLLDSIGMSFREAWNDGTGERIAAHILEICTNINNIIGGFAARLREAWEANDNGVKIWGAILGIVESVLGFFNRITKSTAEWVKNLNLTPLITAFKNLLQAIKPVVDILLDGLAWAWENVVLPFGKWLLELGVPAALDLLASAFNMIAATLKFLQPYAIWIWDNFLQPIAAWTGGVIVDSLNTIATAFNKISDWVKNNGALLEDFLITLGGLAAGPGIASLVLNLSSLADSLAEIFGEKGADIAKALWDGLVNGFRATFDPYYIVQRFMDMVDAIKDFLGIASPSKLFEELGIFVIQGFLNGIKSLVDNAVKLFQDAWSGIQKVWSTVSKWFSDNVVTPVRTAFDTGLKNIIQLFTTAWSNISKTWSVVFKWFETNIIEPVKKAFEAALKAIHEFFQKAWENIKSVWNIVKGWFETNVITPTRNAFESALKSIQEFFSKAWTDIKSVWTVVSGWFTTYVIDPVTKAFDGLLKAIKKVFEDAWTGAKTAWEGAKKWFEDTVTTPIKTAFSSAIKDIEEFFNGLWKTISDIFGKIGTLISNVLSKIEDVISGAGSASKAASNVKTSGASSRSIDISPSLFTPAIGNIEIPKLARGGIVDSATIAMIGEKGREAVVPLSHNAEWIDTLANRIADKISANMEMALSGLGGGQSTVILEVDKRVFGQAVVELGDHERERMGVRIRPRAVLT